MKSNFLPVVLTFLITAGLFIGYYFLFLKESKSNSNNATQVTIAPNNNVGSASIMSDKIDYSTALKYIRELEQYNLLEVNHSGRLEDQSAKSETLTGFVFEAKHLNEIINNNQSILGKTPDSVIFYLGKSGEIRDQNGNYDHAVVKIIAVGFSRNKLYIDNNGAKGGSVYDHANPCPPFCPTETSIRAQ